MDLSAEHYMQRCIDLSQKGAGSVAPNPMVGAVLVFDNRIIGEGWHREFGEPHAEVNCINSVLPEDRLLISRSTLYVSLEPCAHYGKTPPCADLILEKGIKKVVIGCVDSFSKVAGRGIEKLKAAGVEVNTGVLEDECKWLNRRFFTRHEKDRPYVILKWAQSADGYIAPFEGKRVMLSNRASLKWVHKMRSEEAGILVGYRTALLDNPRLNNRYGSGGQPVRVIIDPKLALPRDLKVFDNTQQTIILNRLSTDTQNNTRFIKINQDRMDATAILKALPELNSIIIEGGSKTLQIFIDEGLWDEATVIHTPVILGDGRRAPLLKSAQLTATHQLIDNKVQIFHHENTCRLPG